MFVFAIKTLYIVCLQYRNPSNPLAHYDGTAEEILQACDGEFMFEYISSNMRRIRLLNSCPRPSLGIEISYVTFFQSTAPFSSRGFQTQR